MLDYTDYTDEQLDEVWHKFYAEGRQDQEVRSALIARYYYIADLIAGKMVRGMPSQVPHEEVASWATIGLIQAVDRYDPTMGIAVFTTYANAKMRSAILDRARKEDFAPRAVRARIRDLEKTEARLSASLKRTPTDVEIAAAVGATVEDVHKIRQEAIASWHTHIDESLLERPRIDNTEDVQDYASIATKAFSDSLGALTGEELYVLVSVVYEELKSDVIAATMNTTKTVVNALLSSAILKCHSAMVEQVTESMA